MLGIGTGSIFLPPVQTSALGMPLLHGPDGAMNLLSNIQVGSDVFWSIKIILQPPEVKVYFQSFLVGHRFSGRQDFNIYIERYCFGNICFLKLSKKSNQMLSHKCST